MPQAWHIFKKDVYYLRLEIALLIGLSIALYWIGPIGDPADAFGILMAAAIAFVIAKLVHAEAIPGQNQFWVTRPYRRTSLFAAKLLFILCFVNLPILLAQAGILMAAGFPVAWIVPGLLWMQVLLLVCVALPLAGLASITTGLPAFAGCIIGVVFLYFADWWEQGMLGMFGRGPFATPATMEWLRDAILFCMLIVLASVVLYLQYGYRRTGLSRILAAGIAIAGVVAYVLVPWQTLFPLQAKLSNRAVGFDLKRNEGAKVTFARNRGRLELSVPLLMNQAPPATDIEIEAYRASVETADGRRWLIHPGQLTLTRNGPELTLWDSGKGNNAPILPDYLISRPEQAVNIRVSMYLTLFGNARERTFTVRRKATNVTDGIQCRDGYMNNLICRAAFRWPRAMVYQKSGPAATPLTSLISYSPFPADLEASPVIEKGTAYYAREPLPEERPVTLEVKDPIAYVRKEIVIPDLHLQ